MRDTYEIGSSPNGEDCAQVGAPNFSAQSQKECRAYKNQLERAYPNMPAGMFLKVQSSPHDMGTYYDVVVVFNDESEEHETFLWGNLETGCEFWDEDARKELGLDEDADTPPRRMTAKELNEDPLEYAFASVVPAMCSAGCRVEPDGSCSHGFPSILIDAGIF